MRNRTWIAALALTGCALVAGGCKTNDTATPAASGAVGASATTKAAGAADEVVAAADKLRTTSYKFSMTIAGSTITGAADPATKTMTMDAPASIKAFMVDGEMYMKFPKGMLGMDALGVGDKWLHADVSKMAGAGMLGVEDPTDPFSGYNSLKSATSVQKVGDKHYKGMLDLTKASPSVGKSKRLELLGDSAKAVPFDVTLDDQGRLSTMDMDMKANGSDLSSHTTVSDFGTKVTATKPQPSEVVEMPERFYGIIGA